MCVYCIVEIAPGISMLINLLQPVFSCITTCVWRGNRDMLWPLVHYIKGL